MGYFSQKGHLCQEKAELDARSEVPRCFGYTGYDDIYNVHANEECVCKEGSVYRRTRDLATQRGCSKYSTYLSSTNKGRLLGILHICTYLELRKRFGYYYDQPLPPHATTTTLSDVARPVTLFGMNPRPTPTAYYVPGSINEMYARQLTGVSEDVIICFLESVIRSGCSHVDTPCYCAVPGIKQTIENCVRKTQILSESMIAKEMDILKSFFQHSGLGKAFDSQKVSAWPYLSDQMIIARRTLSTFNMTMTSSVPSKSITSFTAFYVISFLY